MGHPIYGALALPCVVTGEGGMKFSTFVPWIWGGQGVAMWSLLLLGVGGLGLSASWLPHHAWLRWGEEEGACGTQTSGRPSVGQW